MVHESKAEKDFKGNLAIGFDRLSKLSLKANVAQSEMSSSKAMLGLSKILPTTPTSPLGGFRPVSLRVCSLVITSPMKMP